jgi:MYXO-CTERM domain-containing protein
MSRFPMQTRVAVGVATLAVTCPSLRAADLAADNASQAAYGDGWQDGDNGGFGFGPWAITLGEQPTLPRGVVGIGSSTANGDAAAPTGDIDSAGGRAWSLSSARVLGSPKAVRPLTGALAVGQTVSFDVDGIGATANADELWVSIGNAADRRWGMAIHAQGTHAGGLVPAWALVTPDTPEGMRVDFTLTGPDTFTASIRVLDGRAPVLLAGALDGAAGSAIDRLSFAVAPSLGPIDAFYLNNLAVTPEPGSAMLGLAALGLLARRRGRR